MDFIEVRLSFYLNCLSKYKKSIAKLWLNVNFVYSIFNNNSVISKKRLRFGGIYENSSSLC